ncbi:MAG TPA: hypothetical protein VF843_02120 [Streptosporangiaceae bacterium]
MTGTDTDLKRRLRGLGLADGARLAGQAPLPVHTGDAWRDLRARHERSAVRRRRGLLAAAVTAVAALVIAVPLLSRPAAPVPSPPRSGYTGPPPPKAYSAAIAARIPLSGVVAMAGDGSQAYVIRQVGTPGLPGTFQLVAIDLSSDTVSFQDGLGRQEPMIAAGPAGLWVTTSYGQAGGQIIALDPATGRPRQRYHLPAGPCTALSYSAGRLYASCNVAGATRNGFWRIDSRTGRATRIGGTLSGFVSSIVATPDALWYVRNYTQIRGIAHPAGRPSPLSSDFGGYEVSPGGQGLIYAGGSIWALAAGEQLARIDPATGRVLRIYTYRQYDPSRLGGLDFLTAGHGWLWFLDNGYPFSGVLRVSMATGHPAGGVPVPANSCGQQICSQVYYISGSIWVPTAELLLRINPAKLPG